jgi:putative ABC transport system permease protein
MAGGLSRDVAYALRGMAKRPLHATVVVLTLALGIGANTAIFSAVNTVLLHPVPTSDLDRLVMMREDILSLDLLGADLSPGEALDLFRRSDLFQSTAAYSTGSMNLTGLGEPQRVVGARTFGEFFTLFGVRPLVGRLYRPDASVEGAPPVVVLSYDLWQSLGGGDPSFVGRTIELSGNRYEVIGVLPPEFRFPRTAQFFTPLVLTPNVTQNQRHSLYARMVARLRPDVSLEQLQAPLKTEVRSWAERYGGYDAEKFILRPVPFVEYVSGELRSILLVLIGAVSLVLLIACANVASLQLVRAAGRGKEIAVRAALGAGRSAIARQLLVESVVFAILGGLLGLAVGEIIIRAIAALDVGSYEALRDVHLDGRVLAFTGGVALLSGLAFGLFPALRASRVDLQDVLRDASRGSSSGSRQRFLQGSVVVQIALTLVLLLGSAVTVRSLARLLDTDPGFRADRVSSLKFSLSGARYGSNAARLAFYRSVLDRLQAVPGFESAALVSYPPFGGGMDSSPFDIPGRPAAPNAPARHANTQVIEGDYFRTMGIPLLRGRSFAPSDGDANLVVVDEYLAKTFFADEDPIGKQIDHNGTATIIGVVGNVSPGELGEAPHATVYHDYRQNPWIGFASIVVRSNLPASTVISRIRDVVRDLDPALPLFDVKTMPERIHASVAPRRLAMVVLTGFAALSLALALLGIYGVMSYRTAQRTQEIGIRMALGARPGEVLRMVLRNGLTLAGIGLAAGLVLYLGAGRVAESLAYGMSARDPLTIAACVVGIAIVAFAATAIPARRASRIDPLHALRGE